MNFPTRNIDTPTRRLSTVVLNFFHRGIYFHMDEAGAGTHAEMIGVNIRLTLGKGRSNTSRKGTLWLEWHETGELNSQTSVTDASQKDSSAEP